MTTNHDGVPPVDAGGATYKFPDADLDMLRKAMIEADVPLDDFMGYLQTGGQVWTTEQLKADFTVHGFMAPFVAVTRKSDGAMGTLEFIHAPRYYFGFSAHDAPDVDAPTVTEVSNL